MKTPWDKLILILNKEMPMACIVKDIPLGDEEDEQKRNTILETLTAELKSNQKIDVQNGYPTIFKLDNFNNVVYHEGDRTLEDMYQFFTGRPLKHPGQNLSLIKEENGVKEKQVRKKRKSNNHKKSWRSHPRRRKTRRARKPRKF